MTFLRLNQIAMGTFLFAAQVAIFSTALFVFALLIINLVFAYHMEPAMILFSAANVLLICFISSVIAFGLSPLYRSVMKRRAREPYIIVGASALMANAVSIAYVGGWRSSLNFAIYSVSLISVWFGARIYRKTWASLERLRDQKQWRH